MPAFFAGDCVNSQHVSVRGANHDDSAVDNWRVDTTWRAVVPAFSSSDNIDGVERAIGVTDVREIARNSRVGGQWLGAGKFPMRRAGGGVDGVEHPVVAPRIDDAPDDRINCGT